MLFQIDHGEGKPGTPWSFKLEGRLQNGLSQEELRQDKEVAKLHHFLSFFTRVQIEFGGSYPSVDWVKARHKNGNQLDRLEVTRLYKADPAHGEQAEPIEVKVSLHPENEPKKFKLSP